MKTLKVSKKLLESIEIPLAIYKRGSVGFRDDLPVMRATDISHIQLVNAKEYFALSTEEKGKIGKEVEFTYELLIENNIIIGFQILETGSEISMIPCRSKGFSETCGHYHPSVVVGRENTLAVARMFSEADIIAFKRSVTDGGKSFTTIFTHGNFYLVDPDDEFKSKHIEVVEGDKKEVPFKGFNTPEEAYRFGKTFGEIDIDALGGLDMVKETWKGSKEQATVSMDMYIKFGYDIDTIDPNIKLGWWVAGIDINIKGVTYLI